MEKRNKNNRLQKIGEQKIGLNYFNNNALLCSRKMFSSCSTALTILLFMISFSLISNGDGKFF